MFPNPLERIKLAVAAILFMSLGILIGQFWQRSQAMALAEIKLTNQTNMAIEELTSDAEKARINLLLCKSRGGVYDFVSGGCKETNPKK